MAIQSALEAGISVEEFWRLTPWETGIAVRALRGRMNWQITVAHTNAKLQRASKIPPLETLLIGRDEAILDEETSMANMKAFLGIGGPKDAEKST